ncbi:MAG: hypothetical protein M0Z69_10930 [Actinomycetota bacterium]|nr:hypothetical protein [Actinomycetota bacterium]
MPRVQRPPAAAAAARSQLLDSVLDRDLLAYVELAELDDSMLMERDDV